LLKVENVDRVEGVEYVEVLENSTFK